MQRGPGIQDVSIMSSDLTRLSILIWLNCVFYLFGVAISVYVIRDFLQIILILDISILAFVWLFSGSMRARFIVLLLSIFVFQIGIALKAAEHPVANPWIALVSFIMFLGSLFFSGRSGTQYDQPK